MLTAHHPLVPRLLMSGAIPLLPWMPSWRGQEQRELCLFTFIVEVFIGILAYRRVNPHGINLLFPECKQRLPESAVYHYLSHPMSDCFEYLMHLLQIWITSGTRVMVWGVGFCNLVFRMFRIIVNTFFLKKNNFLSVLLSYSLLILCIRWHSYLYPALVFLQRYRRFLVTDE
jgi:hypothetical protein